jgi:hypothetical protein
MSTGSIISALNPDDELAHAGIYDVEVNVVHFTKATTPEGLTAMKATPHQKKVAELAAIFDDPNHDALVALLNAGGGLRRLLLHARRKGRARQVDDGSCWVWRRKLIVTCHLTGASVFPTADASDITADSDTITADAAP